MVFTTLADHMDEAFLTEALHPLRKDAVAGLVLEDKMVRRAVAMLLEAAYELHFHAVSYGFRRKHSAHGALSCLMDQCQKLGINRIRE